MKKFFTKTVLLWPVLIAITCFVAVGALGAMPALFGISPFATESESRNTQVIQSITREEQVVLLSLGIQGIDEKNKRGAIWGMKIPGSERASFMQYNFNAKLGIEGKDVRIKQTGEDKFLVSIPDFIFIGHDKPSFRLVTENSGVLSWMTPRIDPVKTINGILNDEVKDKYVDSNNAILRDQAQVFYEGIITSIDSTVDVEFEFRH